MKKELTPLTQILIGACSIAVVSVVAAVFNFTVNIRDDVRDTKTAVLILSTNFNQINAQIDDLKTTRPTRDEMRQELAPVWKVLSQHGAGMMENKITQ